MNSSKYRKNQQNHYKPLDQILSEISDPEELLEVQEFLNTPLNELPEEVLRLSRRKCD